MQHQEGRSYRFEQQDLVLGKGNPGSPITDWGCGAAKVDEQRRYFEAWLANSSCQFSWIDSYVRERLELFASKKRQKRWRTWGRLHTTAWFAQLASSPSPGWSVISAPRQ